MSLVRQLVAASRRFLADEQMIILDLACVTRNAVGFEAGFTLASTPLELPVVPWTDDIIADEATLPEWSTDVVADSGDHSDLRAASRDGDRSLAQECLRDLTVRE